MTYTPFEREQLKRMDRTNELLEQLVMLMAPTKVLTGMAQHGTTFTEAARAAGLQVARNVGLAAPPTEEERAERFAARAAEVGLSPEQTAEVSGRVATNLDQLVVEPAAAPKRRRVKDAPPA